MSNVKATVQSILEKTGGVSEVYFGACGASYADLYAAYYFLMNESRNLKTAMFTGRELAKTPPKALGSHSVVVLCSRSGNTPELVEAAETARAHGAVSVAFTFLSDSKLQTVCDYHLFYEHGNIIHEKPMEMLQLVTELLHQTEELSIYEKMQDAFAKIDDIVVAARKTVQPRAIAFANARKNEPVINVVASGPAYGAAYMESPVVMMQMQGLQSCVLNSGEFLHGPMEAIDDSVCTILLIANGGTRMMDERVCRFLQRYCAKAEIIDIREFGIDGVDEEVQGYFQHALFNHILAEYNRKLADVRNHPLHQKRYIGKVEY